MNIAVNTRLLQYKKLEGIGWFTYETLSRITKNHPEHNFYFLFDRPYHEQFIFSDNVHPIVAGPQTRHPALMYYWLEFVVPKILKKINADLFFSPDGWLSLKTSVPSVPVMHDLNFEHYPKDLPAGWRNHYLKFFPKYAKKAKQILTVSEFSKSDISDQYKIDLNKISVAYNGVNQIYRKLSSDEIEMTRKKYSEGLPYFIFVGALHPRKNVNRLFLAFNQFKHHTKSDAKLLIVGEKMFRKEAWLHTLDALKYKNDIVFTGRLSPDDLLYVLGSALSLAFVPYFEGFGIPIVEAMKCGVPVITSNVSSMPEVAGEAAVLVDPFSIDEIADAMEKISIDIELHEKLQLAGVERAKDFKWDKTAEKVWAGLEKVLNP